MLTLKIRQQCYYLMVSKLLVYGNSRRSNKNICGSGNCNIAEKKKGRNVVDMQANLELHCSDIACDKCCLWHDTG